MTVCDSRMSLRFHHHPVGLSVGEVHATLGIEAAPMGDAPGGEGIRVNVGFDDNVSLSDISLAALFGMILPLQKGAMELVAVGEKCHQPIVISFTIPDHAYGLDLGGV